MLNRTALLAAAAVLAAGPAFAQANPRGEAQLTLAGKAIAIEYGRPSLKGRDMLSRAEVGQAWRMGADEPTTLKSDADLAFGEVKVPKGAYTLTATKVAADKWHLNVLGADRTRVAEVPLTSGKSAESVETFTIELSGEQSAGTLKLLWGDTALSADFSAR
jgi:hypothetical protein